MLVQVLEADTQGQSSEVMGPSHYGGNHYDSLTAFAGESKAGCAPSKRAGPLTHAGLPLLYGVVVDHTRMRTNARPDEEPCFVPTRIFKSLTAKM